MNKEQGMLNAEGRMFNAQFSIFKLKRKKKGFEKLNNQKEEENIESAKA